MTPWDVSGHFVGRQGRRIFLLQHRPRQFARPGCVMLVPPFAEEMNKSRKMLADLGRRLAQAGRAVVVPDLFGTGDSEGDFAEARVESWLEDLTTTAQWAADQNMPVSSVVAVRLGCALAGTAVEQGLIPRPEKLVYWAPVLDGERYLNQFLRLRVAASAMSRDSQETVTELRTRLAHGESVEVSGYVISSHLASGLDGLKPKEQLLTMGDIEWMEVVRDATAMLPPLTVRLIDEARSSGVRVAVRSVVGEPFWAVAEIVRLPGLIDASLEALAGRGTSWTAAGVG